MMLVSHEGHFVTCAEATGRVSNEPIIKLAQSEMIKHDRNARGMCTITASAKSKRAKIFHGEILSKLGVIAMWVSQRKGSRCVCTLPRPQQADGRGVSRFKEPEQVERSLDVECIISSLTSWVLCKAIVLSVLCSSQRNKEPFETKKAKSIS